MASGLRGARTFRRRSSSTDVPDNVPRDARCRLADRCAADNGQLCGRLWYMEAWIGLAGVIAGAAIALGGQYLTRRSEQRERLTTVLLEQCATVVALSEDFRNRVWEERNQLAENVVAKWDLAAYRLAEARLRILCRAGRAGSCRGTPQIRRESR